MSVDLSGTRVLSPDGGSLCFVHNVLWIIIRFSVLEVGNLLV